MKLLPFLFALCILTSCGNRQNTVESASSTGNENQPVEFADASTTASENEPEVSVMPIDTRIVGTVHVSDSGCPLYIDAINGDKKSKMYPVNLNENLKKEGMRIKFSYALSRAPHPAECDAEQVVTVSDVTPYRGN